MSSSDQAEDLLCEPLVPIEEVEDRARNADRHRSQGTVQKVTEDLLSFVRLGVSDFVFMLDSVPDERSLELLATRVAPVVRKEGSRILDEVGARNF